MEVENTGRAGAHRVTPPGRRPLALTLAQEFELLAPEEFAQTGEMIFCNQTEKYNLFYSSKEG